MQVTPTSLAHIAMDSGFTMSDLAFLAGLDESTICRLWDDPNWLDRITGRSLQALLAVLPGIADYVVNYPLAKRRSTLADDLSQVGLEINRSSYCQLVRHKGVPEQHLINTLRVALPIIQLDVTNTAACLARFWGQQHDYTLGFLFASAANNGLLFDVTPLLQASHNILNVLTSYKNSFHAIIASAALIHHLTQVNHDFPSNLIPSVIERHTALAYRSAMIGLMFQTNNRDVATSYAHAVAQSPLLSIVEGWAFPTFTRDARPTSDFSLPPSLLLRHTANHILWEIDHRNDAYFHYLLETCIPKVIQLDQSFGLRRHDLVSRLQCRLQTLTDPLTTTACEHVLQTLQLSPTGHKGTQLDQPW
jgi:hypothetical protein